MTWATVHLGEVPATPWKNGGGTTRELVVWPNAANWVWRVSVADIVQNGPFSQFEGVTRWFAVLAGAGVTLAVDGQRHTLTQSSGPFCFDGTLQTECELLGGPTQDFNVMCQLSASKSHSACSSLVRRVTGDLNLNSEKSKMIAFYAIKTGTIARFDSRTVKIAKNCLIWGLWTGADGDRNCDGASGLLQLRQADGLLVEIAFGPFKDAPRPDQNTRKAQSK
jgi:uncharacterized protein